MPHNPGCIVITISSSSTCVSAAELKKTALEARDTLPAPMPAQGGSDPTMAFDGWSLCPSIPDLPSQHLAPEEWSPNRWALCYTATRIPRSTQWPKFSPCQSLGVFRSHVDREIQVASPVFLSHLKESLRRVKYLDPTTTAIFTGSLRVHPHSPVFCLLYCPRCYFLSRPTILPVLVRFFIPLGFQAVFSWLQDCNP